MALDRMRFWRLLVPFLAILLMSVVTPVAVLAAGGAFVDDDTSTFEQDIEWLATAGVTYGCNPPVYDNFCPGSNVTRGQMAAFLRRFAQFLGAEDGQVAAADNADTVGGLNPGDLIRINGSASSTPMANFSTSTYWSIQTMSIEAPADGVLLVNASVNLKDEPGAPSYVLLNIDVDGTFVNGTSYETYLDNVSSSINSLTAAVAVTKGQHTVSLVADASFAPVTVGSRSISAIFSPFGGGIQSIPVSVDEAVSVPDDH